MRRGAGTRGGETASQTPDGRRQRGPALRASSQGPGRRAKPGTPEGRSPPTAWRLNHVTAAGVVDAGCTATTPPGGAGETRRFRGICTEQAHAASRQDTPGERGTRDDMNGPL